MDKLKKSLLPVTTFIKIDVKRLFRDRVAIFFVFIFPLIFLIIFGSIFGGGDGPNFDVAVINRSNSEFAQQFTDNLKQSEIFTLESTGINTLEDAEERLGRGEIDGIIELEEDFGTVVNNRPEGNLIIYYDQGDEQLATTLQAVLQATIDSINEEFVEVQVPFTLESRSIQTANLTRFDYTFSGILGFTILSLGIFGPTTIFPRLKQRGVLRRYQTSTLRVWQYFTGNVVSNAFVGLLSLVLMFTTAVLFFDLNMRGSYINLAIIVVLGTILMFGIGLALGGWAKNENQAAPLAQLVTLPMMFLSGVFFPVFLMPDLLQSITQFIPLTPVVESIRLVITENASLLDLAPQISIMLGWTVVIYLIAFKVFRWE
jgi:ABC-2 type transport system permease protein